MPSYNFQGRNVQGRIVKGKIEAKDQDEAGILLIKRQIVPIEIVIAPHEKRSVFKRVLIDFVYGKVKFEDLIIFCRQMYILSKAGVTVTQALKQLAKSTRSKQLRKALEEMVDAILGGKTLTAAMRDQDHIFSLMLINVVDAGENSGQLDTAFLQLAKYLELEASTKKRIKSATRYPTLVIVALLVALIVINFMVVPAFAKMFQSFNAELPVPTQVMIAISNFLTQNWILLAAGVVILFALLRYWITTPVGRLRWDHLKIKVPIIGSIIYRIILARFSRMFAMIMETGVPLVKGINLVANTLGNEYMRQKIAIMREGIEKGESLTKSATDSELFSPMILQMIYVGEQTGEVEQLLKNMAEYYEREVDYDLDRLGDMIEPILLTIIGGMVLFLAIGVFLPMWDMVSFVSK